MLLDRNYVLRSDLPVVGLDLLLNFKWTHARCLDASVEELIVVASASAPCELSDFAHLRRLGFSHACQCGHRRFVGAWAWQTSRVCELVLPRYGFEARGVLSHIFGDFAL